MARILIIEDDMDMALVMRKNLQSRGFQALVAYDSIQGTKLAHQDKPDLIILDLNLPGGGGVATLKHLKLSTNTAMIPVVILSGTDNEALKAQAMAGGAETFIKKPYDLDDLVLKLNEVLHPGDPSV